MTEAAPGVEMTPADLTRLTGMVKAESEAGTPGTLVMVNTPVPAQAMVLRLVFTRYDNGNAVARFMLAGLGQIHLDANLVWLDGQNGTTIARYQVGKTFASPERPFVAFGFMSENPVEGAR